MIIEALRYFMGYVRFTAKGNFPERLLNQLAFNRVSVWGIERRGEEISACISIKDYLKIRKYRGKSRIRTKVTEKKGFVFLKKRYKYRIGFVIGGILSVAALFYLSMFVWNIEVNGNESLTKEEIVKACEEIGLKEGTPVKNIDTNALRSKLAMKFDNIAWAAVNIEGVRATIDISESIGEKSEPVMPCNLVASSDGIIVSTKVTKGNLAVKVGQSVGKGELLVSGITEYKDGSISIGESQGEIEAKTSREITCFIPMREEEIKTTGKVTKRRVVSVLGINIPLYLGSVKGNYKVETKEKRIKKNGMYLPWKLTEAEFSEIYKEEHILTREEMEEKAERQLKEIAEKEFENAEILSQNIEITTTEEGIKAKGMYECVENIAKRDLLLIYD